MDDRDPLEWLEALAEEATPGPWREGGGLITADDGPNATDAMVVHGYIMESPKTISTDARLTVAMRNALPELLAVAKALNTGIPRLTKACVCWPEEGIICDGCAAEAAADALDARLRAEMGET